MGSSAARKQFRALWTLIGHISVANWLWGVFGGGATTLASYARSVPLGWAIAWGLVVLLAVAATLATTRERRNAVSAPKNGSLAIGPDARVTVEPEAIATKTTVSEPLIPRDGPKPLVYADSAGVTGSNNVDVQLHNESDHLAMNITVELHQAGRLVGTKSLPTVAAHEIPPRTDLLPPGIGSTFVPTGLEWVATCTYQGPDGQRWKSVRTSKPGNTGSTLDIGPI
jgi:hypothetical protein